MTKFPIKPLPVLREPGTFEEVVGYDRIEANKKEAVNYDLYRELNNVGLWRDLRKERYTPGAYYHTVITEPKRRELSIPKLRDKIVQLVIHEELQNIYRPVFVERSFACQYGKGPIRAAFNV